MLRSKVIYKFLPFFILLGCSKTLVPNKDLDPSILVINQSNLKNINLITNAEVKTLGVQFGFIILPLGIVSLQDSNMWLNQSLAKEMILNGYKLGDSGAVLNVQMKSLSCNVYDLLVTRWTRCRSKLNLEFLGRSHTISESESRFSTFGFAYDVSICLNKLGKKLGDKIVAIIS